MPTTHVRTEKTSGRRKWSEDDLSKTVQVVEQKKKVVKAFGILKTTLQRRHAFEV